MRQREKEREVSGFRHYKQDNSSNKQSTLTLYHLMCVIWTFIYTSTILKLALHYYIATVATSHIVYSGVCSLWKLFISICHPLLVYLVWTCFQHFSHHLPSLNRQIISTRLHCLLDICSLQKRFVFIQHVGRCHLFSVGLSTFQHIASWLNLQSESHLTDLHSAQLHSREASLHQRTWQQVRLSSLLSLLISLSPISLYCLLNAKVDDWSFHCSATFQISQRALSQDMSQSL